MCHCEYYIRKIWICYELWKQGVSPEKIYPELEIGRRTVYRWIRALRRKGIRKFVREYKANLHNRGCPGISVEIKKRIFELREKYRHCCGEKIRFLMQVFYGISVSVSTIYRYLREVYTLRGKQKRPETRGPVRKGKRPREAVQVDMVDLGELFAFTGIDTFTREVHVSIQTGESSREARNALLELGEIFGFITHIQRDGGTEFQGEWEEAAQALADEIRTSAPNKKNEQAFIERFNRTLRDECLGYGKYRKEQQKEVQEQADNFLNYYHNERPHLALDFATPDHFSMCHVS